jgi:hypothetical protein
VTAPGWERSDPTTGRSPGSAPRRTPPPTRPQPPAPSPDEDGNDGQAGSDSFVEQAEREGVGDAGRELVDRVEGCWCYHESVGRREDVKFVGPFVVAADGMAGQGSQGIGIQEFQARWRGDHAGIPAAVLGVPDELREVGRWPAAARDDVQNSGCLLADRHGVILAGLVRPVAGQEGWKLSGPKY